MLYTSNVQSFNARWKRSILLMVHSQTCNLLNFDAKLPIFPCPKQEVFSCHSRTFLSIIGGVVAGIWGFTGLTGFVFYFLIMMVASIGLLAKSKFSVQTYFDSWTRISIEGVFGGLMVSPCLLPCHILLLVVLFNDVLIQCNFLLQSFVLFWTYPFSLTI